MLYYVYDKFGDGYTFISKTLPDEYKVLIGEYETYEAAENAASDYEDYVQEQIDRSVENCFYDDYYDDEEED